MITKNPENVVINKTRLMTACNTILNDFDEVREDHPGEVATVEFKYNSNSSDVVTMRVYENGTFRIGSCMCASKLTQMRAYARAVELIEVLQLTEA